MGGLFESKKKTTSVQSTKIPSNFQNLMNRTISFANQGLDTPFESYNAPRIAELSGNEQAGIASAGANAGMYQDLINMASMNNAQMQLQGGVPTQGDLDQFMNPYTDYVLGNTLNRMNETSDRNMTNIGSMAGMAGAFGGSRHGVLEGANLAELLKSTQEASANTYSDAFDKGMGNWFNSQNLRRGTISDALNITQTGSQYNTQDINNLMGTGLTERTRNQGVLDFAYSEFMREQQDPFTKAGFAGSVMASYPTNLFTRNATTTETSTPSPFSQIAGIGLAAAGLMTGNPAALAGLGAGAGALGKVTPTPQVQAPSSNPLSGYLAKGGLVKGYAEGGSIEDPIGDLIRDLESQDARRAKGEKIPLGERMKRGRKSTNIEDRRSQVLMSPDAVKAANIPLSSTSFLRDLMASSDSPGSDNWLGRFLKGNDPEANHYMEMVMGFNPDDPEASLKNLADVKRQAAASNALKYGDKLDPDPERGAKPKYAKGGKVKKKEVPHSRDYNGPTRMVSRNTIFGERPVPVKNMTPGGWRDYFYYDMLPGETGGTQHYRDDPEGDLFRALMEEERIARPDDHLREGATDQRDAVEEKLHSIQEYMKHRKAIEYPSKFAKGGKVKEKNKYFLGGYLALDHNEEGTPESRGLAQMMQNPFINGLTSAIGGRFGRQDRPNEATQAPPRAPFDWDAFIQRQGLNSFMTPKFPNPSTPNLPSQRPDLSMFVQAMQNKMGGGQGTPRGAAPNMPGYAEGGTIISGNKKTRAGSRLLEDAGHDGTLEDITYLLDQVPDEEWAQTEGTFDGTHQPIEVDPWDALDLALKKHESGAKSYDSLDYNANNFRGKKNSHAFGVAQWQPGVWNDEAGTWNRRNPKDQVRLMTQEDVKANRLPSKEEQDKVFNVRRANIKREGKGDPVIAFGAHQLGAGDLAKLRNAPMNAKVRDIVGADIAENVSAYNKKKGRDETTEQYFDRLRGYNNEATSYLRNKMVASNGNATDVVSAEPQDQALAAQRAHNYGPLDEATVRRMMRKRGTNVFAGTQPDGRRDRVRPGPKFDEALSPLETVMGGPLAEPAEQDYLKSLIPGLVEQEDLEAPSRFTRGGVKLFNGGGYVKKFAKGQTVETDPYAPHSTDEDVLYKWEGRGPLDFDPMGKQAYQDIQDIWGPSQKESYLGKVGESGFRALASGVPMARMISAGALKGGQSALDFLFNDMNKEISPYDTLPAESEDLKKLRGGMGTPDMDIPNYGQDASGGLTPEAFNAGLESGEPSDIIAQPAQAELKQGEDALTSAFREMIMQEIQDRKNRQEPDENKLFGMDVNMPLIKMGLGILANSDYPNNAGAAIGKGILGAMGDEENKQLAKQERNNNKLKELVNLRYMQAMVESMDPNVKMQLQQQKMSQESLQKAIELEAEYKNWERKQGPTIAGKKEIIDYQAAADAKANDIFGSLGVQSGRVDMTGD